MQKVLKIRPDKNEKQQVLKKECINSYGGKCEHCGEIDLDVLTIDHIYDDGYTERVISRNNTVYRPTGAAMHEQLKRLGFPKGNHQVLCWNCNFRKDIIRRKNKRLKRREQNAEQIESTTQLNGSSNAWSEIPNGQENTNECSERIFSS